MNVANLRGYNIRYHCKCLLADRSEKDLIKVAMKATAVQQIGQVEADGSHFIVTATLIVSDVSRSSAFYRDVLGATVLLEGEPTFIRLGNIWLSINVGGGPTDDKPNVFAAPPKNSSNLSAFLNLRVGDIERCYTLWRSRGAHFITEPKTHATERRCYMSDPDGYLIEVGQTTSTPGPFDLYR